MSLEVKSLDFPREFPHLEPMPIYEYHCHQCGKNHERIQKFSDPPIEKCPDCGGCVTKKVSLSAFQLKGGGWYKDGYASEKPKTEKPEEKKEVKKETPTETSKKESKESKESKPVKESSSSNEG